MTTLVINEKATVKAEGELNTKACKPVVNLTDRKIYTSMLDAARIEHAQPSCICRACSGKGKLAVGKRWCYLSDIDMHLDDIFAESDALHKENADLRETSDALAAEINRLRTEYSAEDIAKWKSAYDAQEAKRKAKEKRERLEAIQAQLREERAALALRETALEKEMIALELECRQLHENIEGDVA